MNSVFRVYRYPVDYAAFIGKDLTPGKRIELYAQNAVDEIVDMPGVQCFPNPFTNKICLKNTTGKETFELTNTIGQTIWSGKQIEKQDFTGLLPGVYFLKMMVQNSPQTIKIIKIIKK